MAKLKVRCLGDLSDITRRDLRAVSSNSFKLIIELDELIRVSRADAPRELSGGTDARKNHKLRTPHVEQPAVLRPPQVAPANRVTTGYQNSDHIFIPVGVRGVPIPTAPALSVRLANVLKYKGFKILGDLHGVRLSDFRTVRNCGRTTTSELEALIGRLQGGLTTAELLQQPGFTGPSPPADPLSIDRSIRDLRLQHLPLSVRAENVLNALGVRRLRDLEGVTASELKNAQNCGKKTVSEIYAVLRRAREGEFNLNTEALKKFTPPDLLAHLDELLLQLSKRDLEIVALRFGRNGQTPASLEAIARPFSLTRERVRQIVLAALSKIVRVGGAKTKFLLNQVAAFCHGAVCPLTPSLLQEWVSPPWSLRYSPGFYVRIVGKMYPEVPAWPDGQERTGAVDNDSESIASALEASLLTGGPNLLLPQALNSVRAVAKLGKTTPKQFLLALKHSRRLRVHFPQPDRPEVKLKSPTETTAPSQSAKPPACSHSTITLSSMPFT